jgi:uncharacterized protein YodC (DUF2158 family)
MTYKTGDVVRLKSGGPSMCVSAFHPSATPGWGTVSCTWLTTVGEPKSYAFDERLVEPVRENLWSFGGGPYKAEDGSVYEYIDGKLEQTKGPDVNIKGHPMTGDADPPLPPLGQPYKVG